MSGSSTDAAPTSGSSSLLLPFAALFVLSGACGLTYEVVWSRHLVHVFGVTAFAVSTVLVSFMGGMAAGAAWLGPYADRTRRPLRLFAILEAGIGIYALLLPLLLAGADALYAWALPALPESLALRSVIRFVFCLSLLAVPTILMGGTLPALGRGLLSQRSSVGRGVGLLYFVNTVGAAIGCFLAGFVLIPELGLTKTTLLAAAFNGLVALIAYLIDRRSPDAEMTLPAAPGPEAVTAVGTSPASWPLIVAFGSGMAALAFEIVWFRVLVLSFGSTVYSFSAMLAVFLLGLAVGSLVAGPFADRARQPVRLLALVQLGVALLTLSAGLIVNRMPALFLQVIQVAGLDLSGMNRTKLLLSLLTLLPPALAFGATFPIAVRLYRSPSGRAGTRIGSVYAWNTLGAIVGSFGAGFLLLPTIGAEWVLRIVVAVAVTLTLGSVLAEPGRVRLGWAVPMSTAALAVLAGLLLSPRWDRALLGAGVYFEPEKFTHSDGSPKIDRVLADYSLINYTEGYNDTIISYRSPKGKFITVNGSATASDQFEDMLAQRMMGHVPMLVHPGRVRNACVIGLGAGVTTGALAIHEVERVVAVELEDGVRAGATFFAEENHGVLQNPVVDVRIDDGRNFLKLTDETFDVISSHPNFPSLSGSGVLFNREFLELAKRKLSPGGVMAHYAPIWRLRPEDVRTIVGTYADVFPHVRMFSAGISLILVGRDEPFPPLDIEELGRRMSDPDVKQSLAEIGVRGPVELASLYQFDRETALRFGGEAPRTTDDRPRIEFNAPHGLFSNTVGINLEQLQRFLPTREERLAQLGVSEPYASSFLVLAEANDVTRQAEIELHAGVGNPMQRLIPVADSGHRYARFLVAGFAQQQGRALVSRGDFANAFGAYRLALNHEPNRLEAMLGLGMVATYLGQHDEAQQVLTAATGSFPGSGAAWYRLGLLREVQGQHELAARLYRHAVEVQPRLAKPHALLGGALLRNESWRDALHHLERAMALGERSEGVLTSRSLALLGVGRNEDALEQARRAVAAYPNVITAWEALGKAASASGDHEEAQRAQRERQRLAGGSGAG